MNTITQITYNEFIQHNSLELFKTTVVALKEKSKKEGLDATEHLLYNLVRGLKINRGFSTQKIEFTEGFKTAKNNLKYLLKYGAAKHSLLSTFSAQTLSAYQAVLEA